MKHIFSALVLAVFACGCADFELKTRDQLRTPESSKGEKEVKVTEAPAPPVEKVEETASAMRQFNGRIEELENKLHQANVTIESNKEEAAKQKLVQDQKITALEEEIKKLEAQVAAMNEMVNRPKAAASGDPGAYISDGDDLTAHKKYKEAIVAYQKYRDAYPKGSRNAETTYKIGVCFQELGMKDESKAFYDEVMTKYGKSPFAKNAAKKLKTLK